jgi:hypothetical protein
MRVLGGLDSTARISDHPCATGSVSTTRCAGAGGIETDLKQKQSPSVCPAIDNGLEHCDWSLDGEDACTLLVISLNHIGTL